MQLMKWCKLFFFNTLFWLIANHVWCMDTHENENYLSEDSRKKLPVNNLSPKINEMSIGDICKQYSIDLTTYTQFRNLALIFKPNPKNAREDIKVHVKDWSGYFGGQFDLTCCRYKGVAIGQFVDIYLGCPPNEERSYGKKLQIWIAPRFLVTHTIKTEGVHNTHLMGLLSPTICPKTAMIVLFWQWGPPANKSRITSKSIEELEQVNLYNLWYQSSKEVRYSNPIYGIICELFNLSYKKPDFIMPNAFEAFN